MKQKPKVLRLIAFHNQEKVIMSNELLPSCNFQFIIFVGLNVDPMPGDDQPILQDLPNWQRIMPNCLGNSLLVIHIL